MNMKTIVALAGVAVAAVAGASTNYVEYAAKYRNLGCTVQNMTRDPALSDPAAFRAAPDVISAPAAIAGRVCVFPQPVDAAECSVTALLRSRFLSGPWSAERRLKAARRRGDQEEIRRMEAMLDALVAEAMIMDEQFESIRRGHGR